MKFFGLEDLSHIIICLSRNNYIGKSMEKEKTITEHVQFLNQINLSETRYAYSVTKEGLSAIVVEDMVFWNLI